jgi:superfamily II DNA/RNA helicase
MRTNVELAGYMKPTPIQQYVLPAIFKGHDVVACAQTGLWLEDFPYYFATLLTLK